MWLAMAGEYRELGALTRAENALARAGAGADDHGIAAWAATTRARYGIPRDGARWNLAVDDDPAAVAAMRNAVSLVNASQWDAATSAIDDAERRWPGLPGVLAARCALEFRRDAIAAARRLCERALAQGGSSWALYLLGTMELEAHRGSSAAGIAHLREAIARDPDLVQAWRKLAGCSRRRGSPPSWTSCAATTARDLALRSSTDQVRRCCACAPVPPGRLV